MSEKQIIGHCPKCGCPIYQDVYWAGSGYPPAEYICKCNNKKLEEEVRQLLEYTESYD